MKKSLFALFIAASFLFSCNNQKSEKKSIELSGWHILGPFKSNNSNDYLQFDNLEEWGFEEKQIDFTSFENIKPDSELGLTNSIYENSSSIIDFCKHFGIDSSNDYSGNAYAACSFVATDTTDFYINFTSDDGGKVYLNNEEIINLEKADLVNKYEIYKQVKLRKGNNLLLIKVNNGLNNWQAFVRLEKFSEEGLKEHINLTSRINNNKFFNLSIYDTTNILVPSVSLPDGKMKFDVFSKNDSSVLSGQITKDLDNYPNISILPDGLYYVKLYLGKRDLVQYIYKGDMIKAIKNSIQRLKNIKILDQDLKGTVDANVYRFYHLLKPSSLGNNHSEKHNWQRKLIYLYKTLIEIEKNIALNKTVHGIPHTVLWSHLSQIDNHDQYYISHVPRDYNPEIKYPTVIFTPYRVGNKTYLESYRVADMGLLENLQYLSDKYQMIVLEPFCREVGRINFNSIGETDLFEMLNEVKKNYNIDTTRLFLSGSCAGADKAISFAVKYPNIFAGIGISSPAFSTNMLTHEWYLRNLPFENIANIKETPICVIHSVNDRHTSIANSLFLEQLAKKNHLEHFTFLRTENDIEEYFWYKYSEMIFEFFSKIQPIEKTNNCSLKINDLKYNTDQTITILERETRDSSRVSLKVENNNIRVETSNVKNFSIDLNKLHLNNSEPISLFENGIQIYRGTFPENNTFIKTPTSDSKVLLKNKMTEGPFTEIFTDRFIVVIGSSGTLQETTKNEKTAQFFNDAWKEKYFNGCIVKYDYQINTSDIKTANLFLIGDFKTNKILKYLEGKIPLSITNDKITIGNHIENGKDLNIYMIYPNPQNKEKCIGIFSGDVSQNVFNMMDIEENEFQRLLNLYGEDKAYFDISCFGWYDYKIWNNSGNTLYSGYFNDYWQNQ